MLGLSTKQRQPFYGRFVAFMSLAISAVLLMMVFAFPKASYAAAVGDTFSSDGFKYEVVEEGKVQLIGWEEDPVVDPSTNALYELRTSISVKEDASYVDYEVVGLAKDALKGFDQVLALDATSDSLFGDALSSESGIGSDVALTLKTDTTLNASSIDLKSSSSYELTEDGSASRTVTLPEGYSFSSYVISGTDTTFTNSTSSAVNVVYAGPSKDVAYSLPVGESLKTKWFRPFIDTLTYSVNGGNEESVSADYNSKIEVTLPEGTPLDATIKVDLSSTPGIAKGFVTSNWDNNQTEVTLENGTASVKVDLISESYISQSFTSTITFKVAESETMPSVWIAGVRYNAPFEKDGMALSYDEQGTPTLTLDGASIDIPSSASEDCAISCQGDLNIVLENNDSSITVGNSQQVINVGGKLDISTANMPSDDAMLKVIYANASSENNRSTSLIRANSIDIFGFVDVACTDEGSGTGEFVTVFDSENDIVVGSRSEVSVGVNNKYRSTTLVPAATYYGLVSHNGSIDLFDSSVTLDGYLASSLAVWGEGNTSGTISVDGRSTLVVNNQNTAQFGAIFNPYGAVEIEVSNQGFVDIDASRPDDADPNLLAPAAIIAKEINISSLDILGEPENGTIETIDDLAGFGELQTIMSSDDKTVPSSSVLIVSNNLNDKFSGKAISSVFSDSFGQFIWTDVLNKTESYDPSYVFTARDGLILTTCTSLNCVDIPAADFASSGIENLPALKFLSIELPDTGTAALDLPSSLYLDELNIYSSLPQSLVINSVCADELGIYAIEGELSNTTSVELGSGSSVQRLRINNTQVADVIVSDGVELQVLDVSNNKIKSLVIPDSSKATLQAISIYGNCLSALDLSDFSTLCNCVLADPDDETRSQQVEFVGVEQKDGSVIVDVSSVADRLENFGSEKGQYNADNRTVVFASAEDAAQGFSYEYDTNAMLTSAPSTSSLMPVQVSIDVQPYDDSSQGDSDNSQTVPPTTDQKDDVDNGNVLSSLTPKTSDNVAPYALIVGGIALVAVIGIVVSLIARARSKR